MFLVFLVCASASAAVEPREILQDQRLEQRARDISKGLRCPVCQNETIDESSAEIAADLRVLVRERLSAGDSDQEVVDFVVARYGEFVLLKPSVSGSNLLLWGMAPLMLIIGLGCGVVFVRRRGGQTPNVQDPSLSDAERSELEKLLKP
ncbi:MAG: cytochrome c-type biogenesis protein [Paracoccaceae bacterium]